MSRVQLKVYLDENVLRNLWSHIKTAYGESTYGALSVEVQSAIVHWLNEKGLPVHTQTRINPGIPRVQARVDQIIMQLKQLGFLNQFSVRDWEKACLLTVGGDRRTTAKYLALADRLRRVKFYGGNTWEII